MTSPSDDRAAAEVLAQAHARAGRPAPRRTSSSAPPPPPAAAPDEEPRPNSPADLGVQTRPRPARAVRPPADPFPGAALVSSQATPEGWSVVLVWPDERTSEHLGRDRDEAERHARDFCGRRAPR